MSNSNKHLDDLFAAARHEEPILSRENAKDLLLENKPMQLPSKLISTKGAIMTSIGLSIAAVTAYVLLSGSPEVNPTNSNPIPSQPQVANLLAHPFQSNLDEPKKSDPVTKKMVIVKKGESVPTPPEPPQLPSAPVPPIPMVPPVLVTPPLKVAGITPVAIAPEKYAKMGITRRDDGIVSFSQKSDKGNILTMRFPKNTWGIIIGDDDQKVSDAPHFAPVIVTDTKGNKRLIQFSSESQGHRLKTMEIQSRSDEEGFENALNIESKMQVGGLDGDMDKLTIGHLDGNSLKDSLLQIELQAESGVHSGNGKDESPDHKQMKVLVKTNKVVSDTTINGKKQKMIVISNVVRKDSKSNSVEGMNLDSIMHEANIKLKIAQEQIKMINFDSLHKVCEKANKDAQIELKNAKNQMQRMNIDSILKSANENLIEAEKVMAKRCNDLNSLIPILVRSSTKDHYDSHENITYDDGLIFWYENSAELTNALRDPSGPEPGLIQFTIDPVPNGKATPSTLEVLAANVLNKTLIYPNPARTNTTVRFTLSEPRNLAFSIHDLLGKRVMEAGNLTATSSGSFEKELNLSELTAGVYLLVITTDKGEQSIQRLVIEK
jgi:hypothetical protein